MELLWQLSAHTLREVHRRTFLADVASNPLPAPLAEIVAYDTRAASLLSVTKVYNSLEDVNVLMNGCHPFRFIIVRSFVSVKMPRVHQGLCRQ